MMQKGGIDDAVAMFRQARKDAQDSLQVASMVALALALDRSGQKEEAKAALADRVHADVKSFLVGDPRVREALGDAGASDETDALLGYALEGLDPAGSREAWRKYLEGPGGKGPWADHAREHAGAAPAKAPVKPATKPAPTRGTR